MFRKWRRITTIAAIVWGGFLLGGNLRAQQSLPDPLPPPPSTPAAGAATAASSGDDETKTLLRQMQQQLKDQVQQINDLKNQVQTLQDQAKQKDDEVQKKKQDEEQKKEIASRDKLFPGADRGERPLGNDPRRGTAGASGVGTGFAGPQAGFGPTGSWSRRPRRRQLPARSRRTSTTRAAAPSPWLTPTRSSRSTSRTSSRSTAPSTTARGCRRRKKDSTFLSSVLICTAISHDTGNTSYPKRHSSVSSTCSTCSSISTTTTG